MDCAQLEMLEKLQQLDFAVYDLTLYLDTHPCDQKALADHQMFACEYRKLKDIYEKKYGPLTYDSPNINADYWSYINSPWPWQIKY